MYISEILFGCNCSICRRHMCPTPRYLWKISAAWGCLSPPSQVHFLHHPRYIFSTIPGTFSPPSQVHFLHHPRYIFSTIPGTFSPPSQVHFLHHPRYIFSTIPGTLYRSFQAQPDRPTEAEFLNVQFLVIFLIVLRLEVFENNVYITNQFKPTFARGGGGGE